MLTTIRPSGSMPKPVTSKPIAWAALIALVMSDWRNIGIFFLSSLSVDVVPVHLGRVGSFKGQKFNRKLLIAILKNPTPWQYLHGSGVDEEAWKKYCRRNHAMHRSCRKRILGDFGLLVLQPTGSRCFLKSY